jgi:hypothetical protein
MELDNGDAPERKVQVLAMLARAHLRAGRSSFLRPLWHKLNNSAQ